MLFDPELVILFPYQYSELKPTDGIGSVNELAYAANTVTVKKTLIVSIAE